MTTLGAIQRAILYACFLLTFADTARSDVLFSDDFNSGASAAWGNEAGNWTADGGVYRAQNPNNFPNTHSFVTTFPSLTDFSVTVDINSARDGGIWLRASSTASDVGVTGILLIFLNDSIHSNVLFWHEVGVGLPGNTYGPELNTASNLPLGTFSLRIDVKGDTYSAYINGSDSPATTLVTSLFASGYTGVYDHDIFNNGTQSFDNFSLNTLPAPVPIPPVGTGLTGIFAGIVFLTWWRKKRSVLNFERAGWRFV